MTNIVEDDVVASGVVDEAEAVLCLMRLWYDVGTVLQLSRTFFRIVRWSIINSCSAVGILVFLPWHEQFFKSAQWQVHTSNNLLLYNFSWCSYDFLK